MMLADDRGCWNEGNQMRSAGRWCILRTSGPSTLRLATSLQAAGFEAWTPVERLRRRVPRSKTVEYVLASVTPTYVFVCEQHLSALRLMERQPGNGHPQFSIFRYYGDMVLVRHTALHPLRLLQQNSYRDSLPVVRNVNRKKRGNAYDVGDAIKPATGPFAGFECLVESSDGLTTTATVIIFGRQTGVKFSTSQLRDDGVREIASAA